MKSVLCQILTDNPELAPVAVEIMEAMLRDLILTEAQRLYELRRQETPPTEADQARRG